MGKIRENIREIVTEMKISAFMFVEVFPERFKSVPEFARFFSLFHAI